MTGGQHDHAKKPGPAGAEHETRRPRGGAFGPAPLASLLGLQRVAGNQALLRLLNTGVIRRLSVDDYRTKLKKGMYSLGSATRAEANAIGGDWIGYKPTGKFNVSEDGLRQYRKASYKPKWKEFQANVESRGTPSGEWPNNGHISITDGEVE